MKILVTGAAGFIGSTVTDRLLSDGHHVVGVDDLSTGSWANLEGARGYGTTFALHVADVADSHLKDIVYDFQPDAVCHLAAQIDVRSSVNDPFYDARSNILGTLNVLEACRYAAVDRVVYAASGGSRYGTQPELPISETAPIAPMCPYAVSKITGELYGQVYSSMYGISMISLALANVYGPRQDPRGEAGVVAAFSAAMLSGQLTAIYGDGSATRDYVYVADVAEAFVRALDAPAGLCGTINIGTGEQTNVAELHNMIACAVGVNQTAVHRDPRIGEIHTTALAHDRATRDLHWRPNTTLADGLRQTVEWMTSVLGPTTVAAS